MKLYPLVLLLAVGSGCGGSDPTPLPMNEFEVTITPDAAFNGETATMEIGAGDTADGRAEQIGDHFDVILAVYNDAPGTRAQYLFLRMFEQPLTAGSTFSVSGNGSGAEAFGTYDSSGPATTSGQWATTSGTIVVEQVTRDYVRLRLENVTVAAESPDPEFGSAELNGYIQLIRADR